MDEHAINEAVEKLHELCVKKMVGYVGVSARGGLRELGYDEAQQDAVILALYEAGFTYCLDPKHAAEHYDPNNPAAVKGMVTDHPPAFACVWGPDQLDSRLHACWPNSWQWKEARAR